jgi:hypothetical protein
VAGGEEAQVLEHADQGHWAVLEQGIYFINRKETASRLIEFFSFSTGRTTSVAVIEKQLAGYGPYLTASPDRRWILLVHVDQRENDIMLMENFR